LVLKVIAGFLEPPKEKRSLEVSIIPFCWCHSRKYMLNIIKEAVMEGNNKQNDT
jgi:hypothetical protein